MQNADRMMSRVMILSMHSGKIEIIFYMVGIHVRIKKHSLSVKFNSGHCFDCSIGLKFVCV